MSEDAMEIQRKLMKRKSANLETDQDFMKLAKALLENGSTDI